MKCAQYPLLILVLALGLGACAQMKEPPSRLVVMDPSRIALADDVSMAPHDWPAPQWWRRYHDTQLDALIDQALRDGPSLAVAEARLRLSEGAVQLADANRGPAVDLGATVDRTQLSENAFAGPFSHTDPVTGQPHGRWYTEDTIGMMGSYTLDIWGKRRAQFSAAVGQRNAQQAELAEANLLLVAAVTRTYCQVQADYAALDLQRRSLRLTQELLQAHQERFQRGLKPRLPIEATRAQLLTIEQQISATNDHLLQSREALRALLGATSTSLTIQAQPLPSATGAIPPTLDYRLLARRPDLQVWRWSVQASISETEAARAAFYPNFDIKAFIGFDALRPRDLFNKASRQINLIPGLSLPIFDSGRLNSELALSKSQEEVQIAMYNQAVVNAVAEVAHAALALQDLLQQRHLQDAKLEAVGFAFASAQAHFERGLEDRLHAMEAELLVLREQEQGIILQNRQLETEILLTMALGGGYSD
ncbi:multidrug resistance transporter [Undibacterium terreum]|uniref:Multidrug resistance transporter n=2 Tax=Undibacterium terreum TaxID=1224302 RepID=A0A916USB1_9BURK|nr:multidrug resistance transporter [Undibacterium terreum]